MFDEELTPARKVISLAEVRRQRMAAPVRVRLCCHCGAALGESDVEDECSGAGYGAFVVAPRRAAE